MKILKYGLLISMVSVLSACGGGGESSSTTGSSNSVVVDNGSSNNTNSGSTGNTTPTTPLEFDLDQSLYVFNEKSQLTINLAASGGDGQYSYEYVLSSTEYVNAMQANSALTVVASDIDYEQEVELTVKVTDGKGDTIENTVKLSVINESAKPLIAKMAAYQSQYKALAEQEELLQLVTQFVALAKLLNPELTAYERRNLDTYLLKTHILNSKESFIEFVENLDKEYSEDYPESLLVQDINKVSILHISLSALLKNHIKELFPYLVGVVPDFDMMMINFDEISNRFSHILGNSDIGDYKEGEFVFKEKHKTLEKLMKERSCSI